MPELTTEQEAELLRNLAAKHPIVATAVNMIDSVMPYGLEGMLEIQKDIEEIKNFEGDNDAFTQMLRDKRTAFRKKHNLTEANDMTEEEELKYKAVANLVKEITKDNTVKK